MDKTPTDISNDQDFISTTSAEERTLRDVVYGSKRSGGNYGSLAQSQTQPIFYICHKTESNDTLQRLALKYSINIQEIKRVNKLWSDAELGLRKNVYIPTNSNQLSTLRTIYPDLEIVQSLSPSTNHRQKSSTNVETNSSYQDYFSKIDQQIRLTKDSLQSLEQNSNSSSNDITNSPKNTRPTIDNNERHKGVHHLSDNSVFVNIPTQNSRDKHVSAALKRLQEEKDNFDEL